MSLWDDIKKRTKEWADVAIDKSQELSHIGKLKLDIINIQRKIEREFVALGGLVYELIEQEKTTKIVSNKDIKSSVANIAKLENELEDKKKELEEIGKEEHNNKKDVEEAMDNGKEE